MEEPDGMSAKGANIYRNIATVTMTAAVSRFIRVLMIQRPRSQNLIYDVRNRWLKKRNCCIIYS